MSGAPLMPKATAVWLIDNTTLTFEQIAEFCKLHPLEVKGIADGEVATGVKGLDPVARGELSREEIAKGEQNAEYRLKMSEPKVRIPQLVGRNKGPRYTPVSRRQDRPNAILWLIRNHPELKDSQIVRLAGTTKATIQQIKERTHWNSANLTPMDPVGLGLCSQIDLDMEVARAAKDRPQPADTGATLLPVEESVMPVDAPQPYAYEAPRKPEAKIDADSVFAKLKTLKRDEDEQPEA